MSLSGPGDWDYAGGHALLRGAGGVVLDENARDVRYGPSLRRTRWCFAGPSSAARELATRPWGEVARARPAGPIPLARLTPGETIADAGLLARAQGCWLGQLTGDSLGSLVEFQAPATIAARHGDGPRLLQDGGVWNTLAGQPTDDSELALSLARSLVARRGYVKEDVRSARHDAAGPARRRAGRGQPGQRLADAGQPARHRRRGARPRRRDLGRRVGPH